MCTYGTCIAFVKESTDDRLCRTVYKFLVASVVRRMHRMKAVAPSGLLCNRCVTVEPETEWTRWDRGWKS